MQLQELELDIAVKDKLLEGAYATIQKFQMELMATRAKNEDLHTLLVARCTTEEKLTLEANCLLKTADSSVQIIEQLQARLDRKK